MNASFTVHFQGDAPEEIQVGDKLTITGEVTVQKIAAALVDVTRLGSDPEFLLGEINIDLVANSLKVTPQEEAA